MVGVVIPNSKRIRSKRIKNKPSNIRYFFYLMLVLMVVMVFLLPYLEFKGLIDLSNTLALDSIAFSFIFPLIAFSYLFYKGNSMQEVIRELGLSIDKLKARYILTGIGLFALFFIIQILAGIIEYITGYNISTNVASLLAGLPLYFYIFAFLIAPINEEILFRGFMVPRFGVVISALIFGALHYLSYFSIAEFVAALLFGLAAGYVLKKTTSLYPSIVGHILFDFVNILILLNI